MPLVDMGTRVVDTITGGVMVLVRTELGIDVLFIIVGVAVVFIV